jgi:hypothetical protein
LSSKPFCRAMYLHRRKEEHTMNHQRSHCIQKKQKSTSKKIYSYMSTSPKVIQASMVIF